MTMLRMRWADTEEDDIDGISAVLPEPEVIGPDERGNKTVIEYKRGDNDEIIKV